MKILLDTCDFLWLITDDPALPVKTRNAVKDGNNEVYLSVVSFWEILVKHARGKLPMSQPPITFIPEQRELHRIATLSLEESAAKLMPDLPAIHRDPFDRMLICQALDRGMQIASSDPVIAQYPVMML